MDLVNTSTGVVGTATYLRLNIANTLRKRTCRLQGISPFTEVRTSHGLMRYSRATSIDNVASLSLISTLSIEYYIFNYIPMKLTFMNLDY